MKLLVCISKTPETTAKITFSDDNKEFIKDGVQFIMNPYDEWYALVRALEIKEAKGGTVTVLNVGTAENDIIIRKGLALGADDAVRIDLDPQSAFNTATQIANYAKDNAYDIIFFGKETIDYNGSEVGGMVAEMMNLPFVSYVSNLDFEGDKAILSRDIEGGIEVSEVTGPFVLSAAKGLAEQRIANMKGIMMSKRKPLVIVPPVEIDEPVAVISYSKPTGKTGVNMVDPENMEELVRLLHEEAKVI
jgi:electron transfer flavoprotein beta subunit